MSQGELFHSTPYGFGSDGKIERDKGLAKVISHNESWMENALATSIAFIRKMELSEFTGEDIRFACQWIPQPKHHNAWGALINTLIKRKIIASTGKHRQMMDRTSHARSTPVYKAL